MRGSERCPGDGDGRSMQVMSMLSDALRVRDRYAGTLGTDPDWVSCACMDGGGRGVCWAAYRHDVMQRLGPMNAEDEWQTRAALARA